MLIEISEVALLSENATGYDTFNHYVFKPWTSLVFIAFVLVYSIKINHSMTSHGPYLLTYFLPSCTKNNEGQVRCLLLILQAMLIWGLLSGNLVQMGKKMDPVVLPVTDVSSTQLDAHCTSWTLHLKRGKVFIDCLKSNQEWSKYIFPVNETVSKSLRSFGIRDCNGERCLKVTVDNLPSMLHLDSPKYLLTSINNLINATASEIEPLQASRRIKERNNQSTFHQWQQIQRTSTEGIK